MLQPPHLSMRGVALLYKAGVCFSIVRFKHHITVFITACPSFHYCVVNSMVVSLAFIRNEAGGHVSLSLCMACIINKQ